MDSGAIVAVLSSLAVTGLTGLLALRLKRTREATSMTDAWGRIDGLQRQVDEGRRAQRITEDGLDAMWRWTQRVLTAWPGTTAPPAPSASEQRDISRARHALELSTGPIPKQEVGAGG
jgi:hypothetical protein